MRTIKFRGYSIKKERFIYGDLLTFENCFGISENEGERNFYIVETNSIGQFTGVYDKNRNEIYEGDILYNEPIHKKTAKYKTPIKNFIVCFEVCGFECKSTVGEKTALLRYNTKCFEVIGNIHDNPELLN
ncbi:YopX family protein [Capnocytophaga leadbetteri]|uniref:YopX family protein n=1 Tax=Capnocytophaga leadbetteri TaxID=327575 RepID=UPI0028EC41EC|nr:YopX family protein [Capnocytophaga leadbetteri]